MLSPVLYTVTTGLKKVNRTVNSAVCDMRRLYQGVLEFLNINRFQGISVYVNLLPLQFSRNLTNVERHRVHISYNELH